MGAGLRREGEACRPAIEEQSPWEGVTGEEEDELDPF